MQSQSPLSYLTVPALESSVMMVSSRRQLALLMNEMSFLRSLLSQEMHSTPSLWPLQYGCQRRQSTHLNCFSLTAPQCLQGLLLTRTGSSLLVCDGTGLHFLLRSEVQAHTLIAHRLASTAVRARQNGSHVRAALSVGNVALADLQDQVPHLVVAEKVALPPPSDVDALWIEVEACLLRVSGLWCLSHVSGPYARQVCSSSLQRS